MRNCRAKPRTLRPNEWLLELNSLAKDIQIAENAREVRVRELQMKPLEFFRQILGFEPTDYQKELIGLFEMNQFLAARWCRQSGKSWTVSGLLLNYALRNDDSYIAVVGPSWRQAKLNIRRISYFLRMIPGDRYLKPGRTLLRFTNGSVIEAFPNNPDTIRGPTLNAVWWDEANFAPNDTDLYDAILFTLGTTNGKLICTSTPWNTDSLFWKQKLYGKC